MGFASDAGGGGESGGDGGGGRGGREIGAERGRDRSRELASPSANFITELVVFAQIISIYSTQAGNLFASECMREWNLPPRSRLARALTHFYVCVATSLGVCVCVCVSFTWLARTRAHTCKRVVGACFFRDEKRKVTGMRFRAKKRAPLAPASRLRSLGFDWL